jgi:hypothetical protein
MANIFTIQTLKDTTEHVVIKLTGKFDGSGQEDNASRIAANSLYGALNNATPPGLLSTGGTALPFYGLNIFRVWYDTVNPSQSDVEIYWNATTQANAMFITGGGEYDGAGNWLTIPNAAKGTAGCNGDIGVRTRGMTANNSYTIIMELRKDNAHYQRGQFNDPAAFNYGTYANR